MEQSLGNHIKQLNTLQYKDQCIYIAKRLVSMEPSDIKHLTFLKKIQIIFTDFPHIIITFMNDIEKSYNQCFSSNMFDDYFIHETEVHIAISYKRISHNEYLITIPIKNNPEDIVSTMNITDECMQSP